ncbi:MAG: recombination mediator RecR [Desulfococcaceae bacterium]|jgi:recombination protein RecR|nr:recombination mediator RecR [Desulfococcaceae bacterium]
MSHYPPSVLNLIRAFTQLPGIGEKTAERLTMHLLRAQKREAQSLAGAILEMKEKTRLCLSCFSLSDTDICRICSNPARDKTMLCVVGDVDEMAALEKSGAYYGLYHILQGLLSPMDGIGPDDLRIREMMQRIGKGEIREVVIATGTHTEGETTAAYISERLKAFPVKVSRIASGVPLGGELRYVDQATLRKAMETRYVI